MLVRVCVPSCRNVSACVSQVAAMLVRVCAPSSRNFSTCVCVLRFRNVRLCVRPSGQVGVCVRPIRELPETRKLPGVAGNAGSCQECRELPGAAGSCREKLPGVAGNPWDATPCPKDKTPRSPPKIYRPTTSVFVAILQKAIPPYCALGNSSAFIFCLGLNSCQCVGTIKFRDIFGGR